jgi:hypothetical protein
MPYDEAGNVVDVMYYYMAGVSRLNTGGLIEGHIGAAIRDLTFEIKNRYGDDPNFQITTWNDFHQGTWDRLVDFYKQTSELVYGWAVSPNITVADKISHINGVLATTARIVLPLDSEINNIDIITNLGSVIEPTYGTIYYTDFLGRTVPLKGSGLIQRKQMLILEKSKLNPMAVSGAIRQIHGLPSGSNKNMRDARPSKVHALVNLSETEVRFLAAVWGGELIAEYIAFNNDPEAHKRLVYEILTANSPVQLPDISSDVNQSRAVKIVKDILLSYGVEIVRD